MSTITEVPVVQNCNVAYGKFNVDWTHTLSMWQKYPNNTVICRTGSTCSRTKTMFWPSWYTQEFNTIFRIRRNCPRIGKYILLHLFIKPAIKVTWLLIIDAAHNILSNILLLRITLSNCDQGSDLNSTLHSMLSTTLPIEIPVLSSSPILVS